MEPLRSSCSSSLQQCVDIDRERELMFFDSLDKVRRVVKVLGMVSSAEGFGDQPKVINGFSDLMVEVFGENGRHARSAVGMAELPMGIPVEIEMILEVE